MSAFGNQPLRDIVSRIIARDDTAAAYKQLLGLVFSDIEATVRATLRRNSHDPYEAAGPADVAVTQMLDKLQSDRFLKQLAAADDIVAYLRTTVRNTTIELLRSQAPVDTIAPTASGDDDGAFHMELLSGDEDQVDDQLARDQQVEAAAALLGTLPLGQQTSLYLRHLDVLDPPPSIVAHIAAERGIPVRAAQQDLDERAERMRAARLQADELQLRRDYLIRLQQKRINHLEKIIADIDGQPRPGEEPVSPEELAAIRRSTTAQRSCTPAQRAALLDWHYARLAERTRHRDEAATSLKDIVSGGPRYEEAALLLGLLTPDDPADARKRVINTLTQRTRRAEKRLRDLLTQEGYHGA